MSFSALSTVIGLGDLASIVTGNVLIQLPRAILSTNGYLIPDCIVEETSRDDLQLTEHPVEIGSTITDHAYKKPQEITLRWSWSNTGYYDTRMQDMYSTLVSFQYPVPQLLTIYTGKSAYQNMAITSIGVTTNSSSEYILNAIMVCRQVILVSTTTTSIGPMPAASSQADQAVPQTTTPIANRGQVSPTSITSTLPSISSAQVLNNPAP